MTFSDTNDSPSILIIEDEYFLASDMASAFGKKGAIVVGPMPSIEESMEILASEVHIDAAVLDINLRGERIFDVAKELTRRRIPFLFVTGYEHEVVPSAFDAVPLLQKPVDNDTVWSELVRTIPTIAAA